MKFRFFGGRQKLPEAKSGRPLNMPGLTNSALPIGSARNSTHLTRAGFLQNPVLFRAVRMIAESAAHVRVNLQDDKMRYDTHPVLDLIKKPNDAQSGTAFFEAIYGHFLLSGQSYIEAQRGEDEVVALYALRPDRMRVLVGRDGWPEGYEYRVGNHKTHYPMDHGQSDILHIKSFHPLDDHYGLSPILAAANAIDVHQAAGVWSKALLDNAARPSGAIVYHGFDGSTGRLSDAQYTRLLDELENLHQGARNAGRPMLLEGGLEWKPMGFSPSDMEFYRTKDTAAREIALAFGVPPMLLGIPGDNTYANYQEANRAFYRMTILPLVERVLSSLNGWLLKNEMARLQVEMESLTALASERESEWRRVSTADFLTRNEKRRLLGFPNLEDEDGEN